MAKITANEFFQKTQALREARNIEDARRLTLRSDPAVQALHTMLKASDAAEVDVWYDANVKTPADQANLLKTILKILAQSNMG